MRSKDICISKEFTSFLVLAKIIGAVGVITGIPGASGSDSTILITLRAIQKHVPSDYSGSA